MLNFMIETWNRLGNWKTSTVGAVGAAIIVAGYFGYVNIPYATGVVALAEAVALFGAKDK